MIVNIVKRDSLRFRFYESKNENLEQSKVHRYKVCMTSIIFSCFEAGTRYKYICISKNNIRMLWNKKKIQLKPCFDILVNIDRNNNLFVVYDIV